MNVRSRKIFRRRSKMLMLVPIGVLVAVPVFDRAMQPGPDAKLEIRTEFGSCHEGGGTNCVVDGDTLWIAGQKVRIAGIDAPETHEFKCAKEAELGRRSADRLRTLLSSGTVVARSEGRDRDPNGRLLRNIEVDGRDVGKTLIAEGLAREYGGGKKSWCS